MASRQDLQSILDSNCPSGNGPFKQWHSEVPSLISPLKCLGRRIALKHSQFVVYLKDIEKMNRNSPPLKISLPKLLPDIFRKEIQLLLTKMKFYREWVFANHLPTLVDLHEIFWGTLREGFTFNAKYKKRQDLLTLDYLEGLKPRDYSFPSKHLIFWEDETPAEDHLFATRPRPPVKVELLERVKRRMRMNIKPNVLLRHFDVIDNMYLMDKKMTYHQKNKGKGFLNSFEARADLNINYADSLTYRKSKITTYPDESRTCGVATVETRNIAYTAHTSLDAITNSPYDAYKFNFDFEVLLAPGTDEQEVHYILIDLKKAGWSTPREIPCAVYDVAHEQYPDFIFKRYSDAKRNCTLDGYEVYGGIIGFDDNALSFFLSCAFEEFMEENNLVDDEIQPMFKGDDSSIKCLMSIDRVREIMVKWLKWLKNLGIIISPKKCRITNIGQFCERYGYSSDDRWGKFHYRMLNYFDAVWTYTVYGAKKYIRNLHRSLWLLFSSRRGIRDHIRHWLEVALQTVIFSFPFEFTENERALPFELGGWVSFYNEAGNKLLLYIEKGRFKGMDPRFRNIGIFTEETKKKFDWKRKTKLKELLKDKRLSKETIERFKSYYTTPPSFSDIKEAELNCAKKRQEAFKERPPLLGAVFNYYYLNGGNYIVPASWFEVNMKYQDSPIANKIKMKFPNLDNKFLRRYNVSTKSKHNDKIIDLVRAQCLIATDSIGNPFCIRYTKPVPWIVRFWSLCPYVFKVGRAVPISALCMLKQFNVNFVELYKYYVRKGVYLYGQSPCYWGELGDNMPELKLFLGEEDSDTLVFDLKTGLPIKFRMEEYINYSERFKKKFFHDYTYLKVLEYYPIYEPWFPLIYGEDLAYLPDDPAKVILPDQLSEAVRYSREAAQVHQEFDEDIFTLYLALNFIDDPVIAEERYYEAEEIRRLAYVEAENAPDMSLTNFDDLFENDHSSDPTPAGSEDDDDLSKYIEGFDSEPEDPDDPYRFNDD